MSFNLEQAQQCIKWEGERALRAFLIDACEEVKRLREIIAGGNCIRDDSGLSKCERLENELFGMIDVGERGAT